MSIENFYQSNFYLFIWSLEKILPWVRVFKSYTLHDLGDDLPKWYEKLAKCDLQTFFQCYFTIKKHFFRHENQRSTGKIKMVNIVHGEAIANVWGRNVF